MADLKLMIAVALIAILLALFARGAYDPVPRPQSLGDVKNYDDAVQSWKIPQRLPLPYGRYKKPLPPLDYSLLESQPWQFLRLKRWHYVSFNSNEWFCGMAIAHLGYVANGFLYLVNKQTGVKYEITSLSPLGYAVTAFNNTSVHGCSIWTSSSTSSFGVCSQDGIQHFKATSITLKDKKGNTIVVDIDVKFQVKETLSLLYPIGISRPAYTDKAAGMIVSGTFSIQDQETQFITGLGAFDWTYSLATHITKWKWTSVSMNVLKQGDSTSVYALGINLSDDIYNDDQGISQENGVWLDGVMHLVGHVKYILPKKLETEEWKVETTNAKDHVQLALTFQPHGIRSENVNLGLIASDFIQPYGEFNGYVSIDGVKYVVEKGYGVMENHYAKW